MNGKQKEVFVFLKKRLSCGNVPSIREICAATGIKSTSSVHKILCALEEEGLIIRDSRSSRCIRLANSVAANQVPILGKVTAGLPILAEGSVEGYFPVAASLGDEESLFALRVSGLSMKNAGILDGDIVVADSSRVAADGDIVIGLIDDEATVKRLGFENGQAVLYPENPEFSPIRDCEIRLLGTVVGSYRTYR